MNANANDTAAPAKADPTTGHTPTPWKIATGRKGVLGDEDSMKSAIFIHGPPMFKSGNCPDLRTGFEKVDPTAEERANAALLVRAVNAHAALVEALEMFERATDSGDADDYIDAEREMKKALKMARGEA